MEAPGRPSLTFAFHGNATIPSGLVRKILIRDVGPAVQVLLDVVVDLGRTLGRQPVDESANPVRRRACRGSR